MVEWNKHRGSLEFKTQTTLIQGNLPKNISLRVAITYSTEFKIIVSALINGTKNGMGDIQYTTNFFKKFNDFGFTPFTKIASYILIDNPKEIRELLSKIFGDFIVSDKSCFAEVLSELIVETDLSDNKTLYKPVEKILFADNYNKKMEALKKLFKD